MYIVRLDGLLQQRIKNLHLSRNSRFYRKIHREFCDLITEFSTFMIAWYSEMSHVLPR